ncbi:hypothetical protein IV203_004555 [Nitzschia inconspicua]|uniref:Uncharacterized protein n=1 Tax=Nitzschia inconspicua TaxID=303405 RepID=A0A9K3PRZ5_9STRA|nr:hypothetical protein IV203_004555 [Nitzschia inconspicua]
MVDQPCDYAKCRDQCSCCDGDVCPSKGGLQKCTLNGAPSEDFCSSESAGITCETLGNPICSGTPDDVTTTTSDPASTTSKPQGTNPSSPIGTTEPGGSNSASSPQYTESTPNSQTTSTATSKDDPPLPLSTSTATSKDDPPIAAIVAPVVVAVIGLAVAVVQRKKIVHVYNHYRVGDGISANPAKP